MTLSKAQSLRAQLVKTELEWEEHLGVGPAITSIIGELDAALSLVGMPEPEYCDQGRLRTSVTPGYDFEWPTIRYQVTASRDNPACPTTLVGRRTGQFDKLIWVVSGRFSKSR
jgi:hypothetical protein